MASIRERGNKWQVLTFLGGFFFGKHGLIEIHLFLTSGGQALYLVRTLGDAFSNFARAFRFL